MKSLALSLAVLLCVSVAWAGGAGYEYTYKFDGLTGIAGEPLDGQVDNVQNVTWTAVVNQGLCFKTAGLTPDEHTYSDTAKQERIYALPTTGSSLFNLSSSDTYLRFSYDCNMALGQGSYLGIYVDLDPNAAPVTNDSEMLCQVGIGTYKATWRVRGAAGSGSRYADPNWTAVYNATLKPMTVHLYMDLTGNYGDGAMSLAINDGSGWVTPIDKDTGGPMANMPMGLLSQNPLFSNPANWTGFGMRGQQDGRNTPSDPNYTGPMTFDNLQLEVLPEPATLTLLALGGLACIRRRR